MKDQLKQMLYFAIFLLLTIILLFVVTALFTNCHTNEPIIIYNIPTVDVSDDMTLESYLQETTKGRVELLRYVKELVNQILFKCNHIDMRKP